MGVPAAVVKKKSSQTAAWRSTLVALAVVGAVGVARVHAVTLTQRSANPSHCRPLVLLCQRRHQHWHPQTLQISVAPLAREVVFGLEHVLAAVVKKKSSQTAAWRSTLVALAVVGAVGVAR